MNGRAVPFTTKSGLQIGKYYVPAQKNLVLSRDMERLQTSLLQQKPVRFLGLRGFLRWLLPF